MAVRVVSAIKALQANYRPNKRFDAMRGRTPSEFQKPPRVIQHRMTGAEPYQQYR
jgi:hypothetical protein